MSESFKFSDENLAKAKKIIAKYPEGRQQSAVLPLLDLAQRQNNSYATEAVIDAVAAMLGMPRIRVLEVASFYTMFNPKPVGKYHLQCCTTTPCWLRGSDEVVDAMKKHLGIGFGEMTTDGLFSMLEVECLGACVNAPVVQINDDFYEDLDAASVVKILEALRAGTTPEARTADRPPDLRAGRRAADAQEHRDGEGVGPDAAGQGPHLHQPLRPARLGPGRRAPARRLGRHRRHHREGPRRDHRRDEGVRPARPRRRRLPDRPQMVVHAEGDRRPAALSRGQRRRGRARHLQGPRHPAPRPAQAGRGLPGRRLRHGRARRLHLHPRRVLQRGDAPAGRHRRGLRGGAARARTPAARAGTSTSTSIAAPAPISAARRRRCSRAWKARRASRA